MRMKLRMMLALLMLLCLLGGCAAPASPPTDEKYDDLIVVGFSQVGAESDWRNANTRSMLEALSAENGFRLIIDDAQQKKERQITAIRNFIHQGVDYIATTGKEVMATNNGKVVYVGYLDLPGYMVVIDHGLGLKSWYCHLGSTAVTVGQSVNKGDVVGYAGTTGFTVDPFPHIGLSVYDVPVCPYDLWDYGILMTE